MILKKIKIVEQDKGWFNKTNNVLYKTAVQALQAIIEEDKKGGDHITLIDWETKSKVGTAIVNALQ